MRGASSGYGPAASAVYGATVTTAPSATGAAPTAAAPPGALSSVETARGTLAGMVSRKGGLGGSSPTFEGQG